MRIISGRFGRRVIEAPVGRNTRPTTDRVREAMFSALESRTSLVGKRVLDLFAGSGALGLEALSRGASLATFVDTHAGTLAIARGNATKLDATEYATFVRADVSRWLMQARGPFDIIFADPPYDIGVLADLPRHALPALAPSGWLVLEHDKRHGFEGAEGFDAARAYGSTVVSFFQSD